MQAELFHANLRFQKEKNFEETLCLQPRQCVSISLHLRLYANYCSSADFAGDKKIDFEFPNACLLGHPFILAIKILKDFLFQRLHVAKLGEMLQLI